MDAYLPIHYYEAAFCCMLFITWLPNLDSMENFHYLELRMADLKYKHTGEQMKKR